MKRRIITIIAFCLCLVLALTGISRVLSYKYPEGIGAWDEYYSEEADLDVMLFGSSHILRQINPAIIFNEKGIAAYDLATGGEAIWTTYYAMEEALKYQTPKVALVDIYMINRGDLYDDTHNITGTFGMKRSVTWFKDVMASVPEKKMYYLTRYPLYHTRYKSLTEDDFKSSDELYQDILKGFLVDENHWITREQEDISGMAVTDEVNDDVLPERASEYLDKIVDLAKEKKIKLVFIQTPYYCTPEAASTFNVINRYVDNESVFFWDCNRDVDQLQLNNKTDFRDGDHLNWRGSQKLSRLIAEKLASQFELDDHTGNLKYKSFEDDYDHYCELVKEFEDSVNNEKQ